MPDRILIVDDEQNILKSIEIILGGVGFTVVAVDTGEAALEQIQLEVPDAIFLDINLPGIDGMEVLRDVRRRHPDVSVIMISGQASIERAVEATRLGAFDFVEKPFSRDRIHLLARNAAEATRLKREVDRLRVGDYPDQILGESREIRELRETIAKVAQTDARVLIVGESGTGKELVASALHRQGARALYPCQLCSNSRRSDRGGTLWSGKGCVLGGDRRSPRTICCRGQRYALSRRDR